MDFKVTGTRDGITACQMDIKIKGLTYEILEQALEQAKQGRMFILDKMLEVISEPRPNYKPHAPKIHRMHIPTEMIGALIGPGGRIIQKIQEETNTTIVIEPTEDYGIVNITASSTEDMQKAIEKVKKITAIPEVGEVYEGEVKAIVNFGAFVEILPGRQGLLHISEIDNDYVDDISKYFKVGDKVKVMVIDYDKETGNFKLSRKRLLENNNHNHHGHHHNPKHKR